MEKVVFPHQNIFLKDIEKNIKDKSFIESIKPLRSMASIQIGFSKIFSGNFIEISNSNHKKVFSLKNLLYTITLSGLPINMRELEIKYFTKLRDANQYTVRDLNLAQARNLIRNGYLKILNIKINEYQEYLNAYEEPSYVDSLMENAKGVLEPEILEDGMYPFAREIEDIEIEFTGEQITHNEKWLTEFETKLLATGEYTKEQTTVIKTIIQVIKKRLKKLTIMEWLSLLLMDYQKIITYLKLSSEVSEKLFQYIKNQLEDGNIIDYIDQTLRLT